MGPELFIPVGFFLFVFCVMTISTYNKFVRYRNRIEESWSGIDVALKRRSNLLPGLVRIIEGYSAHESKLFSEKTKGLQAHSAASRLDQESQITQSIGGLLAVAEAYPELRASANFLEMQNSLDRIEQEIQTARNTYNGFVGQLNTLVESFPSSIIARLFHFEKQDYLALELATGREMPDVGFT